MNAEARAAYLRAFETTWDDATPADAVRFVALDTETTGLDARTDRIVSIGAVAVRAGQIDLADAFECVLKVSHNTSAVTVHGVTRDDARHGREEADALADLLGYLRDGVIVGHHIGHDLAMLNAAARRQLGIGLANRSLETMDLALHLRSDGALALPEPLDSSLDALLACFSITPHDRHTAPGDALLTAQVFQRLLRLAARGGRRCLGRLLEPCAAGGAP